MTDEELVEREVRTMFRLRPDGRLLEVMEPGPPGAPLWYLGRWRGGARSWLRSDAPEELVRAATVWTERLPPFAGVPDETVVAGMRSLVEEFFEVQGSSTGPSYVFEGSLEASDGAVDILSPRMPFHPHLESWSEGLEAFAPVFGVVRDGVVVSVCGTSRAGERGGEAGVETASDYRRQGLARIAVGAWASAIQAGGRTAFYSTSWENVASQAVARSLGLRMFGEGLWVR